MLCNFVAGLPGRSQKPHLASRRACEKFSLQVRQLFDLGPQPLQAASNRELLGALLTGLRDLHWCKAIGCRTERALTIPLSLDVVMHGNVPKRRGYQIERAIAAAQRCCLVLPNARSIHTLPFWCMEIILQQRGSLFRLLTEVDYLWCENSYQLSTCLFDIA